MKIIAHRGFWKYPEEKNSLVAFKRAADHNFGVETDIRDFDGRIVISHDIPCSQHSFLDLDEFIDKFKFVNNLLAINIKSDGLSALVNKSLLNYKEEYFCFDMSIPDTLGYINSKLNVYTRYSEEENLPFLRFSAGIWLDSFYGNFSLIEALNALIYHKKRICIVSPELHGRKHMSFWRDLMNSEHFNNPNLSLCTDYPDQAEIFFK